ncbi:MULTISPECIES: ABC transporter ATP-binding protein [Bacillus cereus group]|uniref:ABC transporter ATP-binding protein n=1 Tax=Bacillus cereus group TaxID=86661 RepID=UPI001CB9A23B|nr:ABC transporter ATP-binding protein [Bacillus cereus]MED3467490.1 ABC transporter ATP-binding protein [Bacillus thuringiensis]
MKLIYIEHPLSFILYFILSIFTAIIPPVLIFLDKNIIDTVSGMKGNSENYTIAIYLLIALFIIKFTSELLENTITYIFTRITQTVNFILKKMILTKLIQIPLKEYESSVFFDTINLATMSIKGNGIHVVNNAVGVIKNIISLIGILGILLAINWLLPIALFISTLPGIIIIFILKIKDYKMNKKIAVRNRELNFTDSLFVNKNAIREMKINNSGVFLIEKWSTLYKNIQKSNLKLALWECKTKSFASFILQVASLGVALLLVKQMYVKTLSIGDYVALLTAVVSVQNIFGLMGANMGAIFETVIYNNALMSILEYEIKETKQIKRCNLTNIRKVNLENVSFCYPGTQDKVLDNINLEINKGEKISIVGYNGSGKTTLVNCILGLYEVDEGIIKINEENIDEINKTNYSAKVSAVFQDFYKYKYSVRENIGLGDLTKINNEEMLYDILSKVGLYEKIRNYKQGLNTYLTREMDAGKELSGGEWQRIAIARGFLKDADLIILDEPTAALDPVTELNVFKLFNELSQNKTTITISHRLGPTKFADRIIVMAQGKIVEEGNYNELIKKKGLYYEMYMSQLKWYE